MFTVGPRWVGDQSSARRSVGIRKELRLRVAGTPEIRPASLLDSSRVSKPTAVASTAGVGIAPSSYRASSGWRSPVDAVVRWRRPPDTVLDDPLDPRIVVGRVRFVAPGQSSRRRRRLSADGIPRTVNRLTKIVASSAGMSKNSPYISSRSSSMDSPRPAALDGPAPRPRGARGRQSPFQRTAFPISRRNVAVVRRMGRRSPARRGRGPGPLLPLLISSCAMWPHG